MEHIVTDMGCNASIDDRAESKSEKAIKAAVLIQKWYRSTRARLEISRRYSLTIFQSIEYADEQDQAQLASFFTFMLERYADPVAVADTSISPSVSHKADSYLTEYENIEVPDSYCGPRLSFPLTLADANALLHAFKDGQLLHAHYVLQLLCETRRVLKEKPNINLVSVSYSKEITVCGDLHGNLDDLFLIFYKNGLPSEKKPYVFNGDFVDRGRNSMEILIILFAFLLIYPNDVHLNRGNHEDYVINLRYGFSNEVLNKYKVHGKVILYLLQDVFSWLPLATIINKKVLIVHGGISNTTDLDFLNLLERNKLKSLMRPPKPEADREEQATEGTPAARPSTCAANEHVTRKTRGVSSSGSTELSRPNLQSGPTLKEWKQVLDILWSDPRKQNGCVPNKRRGGGCYFGPDTTARLLERYNLKMLIRSHEFKREGYELTHGGKVITIFSASNYYEEGSNRGAYIRLNPDLIPHFVQYQVRECTDKQNYWERVKTIERSALQTLREKIFAHRSTLTEAFAKYDCNNTGKISVSDWAAAMESVLCLELPWRTLQFHLVKTDPDGKVDYMSCFHNMEIAQSTEEVQPALVETLCKYRKDLEIIFNIMDEDQSGLISFDEFRKTWRIFSSHLGIDAYDASIDKLAQSIDYNKDDYIDFSEFLEAFHVVHKRDKKPT
ncbi:serine/threonine-protein phosphatase with EF-hands 1 isoform X1 [Cygnus olor]|uniref:serine/threonine-protein phosphatase with EF-hands 1 isoform X1 n=1 Tax=Cygnus olor TaxID=8869 RepID=UPI001ADE68BB|nr:serine/threonine-protein phosphatase with EF-hands 1 isoform X1 [Cygnus olor]XP_040388471.1 serine/threonine-protein phosphatase with EF-hands 1 isoform X1 [Cygnus olor]XP_040388475.1 serine/threonine-protein phosphatase with EF-hands 1 isoform X1 [Cygnus olor]XP_040388477.1 serine/threonine-protein phosphatase with EF-hands 1 isoform X1 [Cygnus olor]XP_040388481.1 serine/threonine-protein phosphatase with EF-hands 1 isoform X1 [Cygnus olor]